MPANPSDHSSTEENSSDQSPANAPVDRRRFLALGAGAAGAALLAACSSSKSGSGSSTTAPNNTPTTTKSTFPLGALKSATLPVDITFWHSMQSANLTSLQSMTSAFNSSQGEVKVTLVNQDSYTDTLTLYTAALSGGTLPDVVQM